MLQCDDMVCFDFCSNNLTKEKDFRNGFFTSTIHFHSNELKLQRNLLLISISCFFIFVVWSYYDRLELRTQYERILKDLQSREEFYNTHIDNTVGYLENVIDLLKKLKFPSFNRPPIVYNHML